MTALVRLLDSTSTAQPIRSVSPQRCSPEGVADCTQSPGGADGQGRRGEPKRHGRALWAFAAGEGSAQAARMRLPPRRQCSRRPAQACGAGDVRC